MEKNIFILASACVLTILEFITTKGTRKYTGVGSGDFKSGLINIGHINGLASPYFTTSSSGKLVRMVQTNGTSSYSVIATLYTSATMSSLRVYHR